MNATLSLARQFHEEGRYADAARCYHSLVEADPINANALHLFGVLHYQNGYHTRAVELIDRAIALRPDVAAYHANQAEAHRALGQHEEAAACCRTALLVQPHCPEAASNLGLALFELGRHTEAIEQYRAALTMQPDFAMAQNNLGNALRELGQLDEALEAFRAALALDPDHALAHSNLGQLLLVQGQAEEALPHLQDAVRLQPDLPAAHNNLGNGYRALERWEEAFAAYDQALHLASKERPEVQARVHANLGFTLQLKRLHARAIACFRRATKLAPEDVSVWQTLADACVANEDYAATLPCYERVVALRPQWAQAHANLGWGQQEAGRLSEAAASYHRALELQPGLLDGLLNQGQLHEELGKMAQAEDCYRRARASCPRAARPLASLAHLLRDRLPEPDLDVLRQRLEVDGLPPEAHSGLLFGLAQVHDGRGEYTEAAACLARANPLALELRRQRGRSYDPARHSARINEIIAAFTPELFARLAGAGDESRRLVFVFGMPRSGTTLVEQVLASHSQVFGAGELSLAVDTFAALLERDDRPETVAACLEALCPAVVRETWRTYRQELDAIIRAGRAGLQPLGEGPTETPAEADDHPAPERIVDKLPDNYLHLGLLALLFPKATFIHVCRDLRDVAVSCWMTNFRGIRWANHPEHLAGRIRDYRRLMAHWHAVLPVSVHKVVYERLVEDFEPEARRLVAACGLEWQPACAQFHHTRRPVRTASVTQVRQPLYRRSLARWKNYEDTLADLFTLLPER